VTVGLNINTDAEQYSRLSKLAKSLAQAEGLSYQDALATIVGVEQIGALDALIGEDDGPLVMIDCHLHDVRMALEEMTEVLKAIANR
jgi:hypothetical protein